MPIKPDPKAVSELQVHCQGGAVIELPASKSEKSISQRMRALICLGVFTTSLLTGCVNSAIQPMQQDIDDAPPEQPTAEMIVEKQAAYKGMEGYQKMISEIRESLYEEIPEAKGKIEIFDFSGDPVQEAERIEQALSLGENGFDRLLSEKGELLETVSGAAYPSQNAAGEGICVAAGWMPQNVIKAGYDLDFDSISTLARITLHETFHCLDDLAYELRDDTNYNHGWVVDDVRFGSDTERYAEMGAQAIMLRNGDTPDSTIGLVAQYDYGKLFSKDAFGLSYDTGDFLMQVLDKHPGGNGLSDFKMTGWRETINEISEIRDTSKMTKLEASEKYFLSGALKSLQRHLGGRTEAIEWLREHQDIHPDFKRIVAARDFLGGKTETVRDYTPSEKINLEVSFGRALQTFQETKDPAAMKFAQSLSRGLKSMHNLEIKSNPLYENVKTFRGQEVIDSLMQNPGAVAALASGKASLNEIHEKGMENYHIQKAEAKPVSRFMKPASNIDAPTNQLQSPAAQQPSHKL